MGTQDNYGPMGRMKKDGAVFKGGYLSGNDAAYIEPKLIPDYELLPRDDSGGPEFDPHSAQFGEGGYVTGEKSHLSARGVTSDDDLQNGEVSGAGRAAGALKGGKLPDTNKLGNIKIPDSSKKLAKE